MTYSNAPSEERPIEEQVPILSFERSTLREAVEVEFELALIARHAEDPVFSIQEDGKAMHDAVVPEVLLGLLSSDEPKQLLLEPHRPPSSALQSEIRHSVRLRIDRLFDARNAA